jgi:hypothetical protein
MIGSSLDLENVVALLAGHLDLPLAPWGSQTLFALGAAEVFVEFPVPEAGVLELEPVFHRSPEPKKGVVFPLAGGVVSGEHAEQHIDENGVRHQSHRPEETADQREDQGNHQQEQAEFITAVAAVHELLKLLQQQAGHILSKNEAADNSLPRYLSVYWLCWEFSTVMGELLR